MNQYAASLTSTTLSADDRPRSDGDGMDMAQLGRNGGHLHSGVHKAHQKSKTQKKHTNKQQLASIEQIPVNNKGLQVKRAYVPHEPYKAAVQWPIVTKTLTSDAGSSGHHFLIPFTGALCRGVGGSRGGGGNGHWLDGDLSERIIGVREVPSAERVWAAERDRLEGELQSLRLEKCQLESQLRVQTQVNGELKRLLVASVGEDMETRVHFLTEDKTRLAHSLMHCSQKQTEDTEHLERLTIQCDVWRSKFLATSLMVDELASWKAVLGYRLDEALEAIRLLLEEFDEVHHHSRNALGCLGAVLDSSGLDRNDSQLVQSMPGDVVKDAAATEELALTLHCELIDAKPKMPSSTTCPRATEFMTTGQRWANQVLVNSQNFDLFPSVASSGNSYYSGRGSTTSSTALPRFHLSTRYEHLTFNCCGHCKGDIKLM